MRILNTVKMVVFSQIIYRVSAIAVRILAAFFFSEIDKQILKFMQNQECQVQFLKRRTKFEDSSSPLQNVL